MRMPTYTHACVACWKWPYILVCISCEGCTGISSGVYDLSDGDVSSDGEPAEDVNIRGDCDAELAEEVC